MCLAMYIYVQKLMSTEEETNIDLQDNSSSLISNERVCNLRINWTIDSISDCLNIH